MSTAPLFLVEALPQALPDTAAADGRVVQLAGPEGRHAAAVRRIRPGEQVMLGDGRGTVARAVTRAVGKDALDLELLDVVGYPPPAPRILLAQALVKGERGELAVELATEAGVDAIIPWRAARSVARWEEGPRGEKALARWRSTVREAAKQARRPWVPEVREPVTTSGLAAAVGPAAAVLVLHESAERVLAAADVPRQGDLVLIVGPEGGVSEAELATFAGLGARVVRLGPEVLRASTAAAVALGALGVLTGRWAAGGAV